MRTITRWIKGDKVQIRTESTPYTADRAKEILGRSNLMQNPADLMTDGEAAHTMELWDAMPGHTCFYDAVCRIAYPKREEPCDMREPYQTKFGKGFIRNAGQIIPCFRCNQ